MPAFYRSSISFNVCLPLRSYFTHRCLKKICLFSKRESYSSNGDRNVRLTGLLRISWNGMAGKRVKVKVEINSPVLTNLYAGIANYCFYINEYSKPWLGGDCRSIGFGPRFGRPVQSGRRVIGATFASERLRSKFRRVSRTRRRYVFIVARMFNYR